VAARIHSCGSFWGLCSARASTPRIGDYRCPLLALLLDLIGLSLCAGSLSLPNDTRSRRSTFLTHLCASSDHVYDADGKAWGPLSTAADAITQRASLELPLIIVTATGGGIHASYWTASILTELESDFRARHTSLHESMVLFSSVSGGSVAAADWLQEYEPGGCFTETFESTPCKNLALLKEAAAKPSVEAAAWGLLHHDLYQFMFPRGFLRRLTRDRGYSLERSVLLNRYMARSGIHNSGCTARLGPRRVQIYSGFSGPIA
jgi:hypothetical protein